MTEDIPSLYNPLDAQDAASVPIVRASFNTSGGRVILRRASVAPLSLLFNLLCPADPELSDYGILDPRLHRADPTSGVYVLSFKEGAESSRSYRLLVGCTNADIRFADTETLDDRLGALLDAMPQVTAVVRK